MSAKYKSKTWLIGYDISSHKRLRAVHRFVSRTALSLQYSSFCLNATDIEIEDFLSDLSLLIEPTEDDVRVYHLPEKTRLWRYGADGIAEGIVLSSESVVASLQLSNKREAY